MKVSLRLSSRLFIFNSESFRGFLPIYHSFDWCIIDIDIFIIIIFRHCIPFYIEISSNHLFLNCYLLFFDNYVWVMGDRWDSLNIQSLSIDSFIDLGFDYLILGLNSDWFLFNFFYLSFRNRIFFQNKLFLFFFHFFKILPNLLLFMILGMKCLLKFLHLLFLYQFEWIDLRFLINSCIKGNFVLLKTGKLVRYCCFWSLLNLFLKSIWFANKSHYKKFKFQIIFWIMGCSCTSGKKGPEKVTCIYNVIEDHLGQITLLSE